MVVCKLKAPLAINSVKPVGKVTGVLLNAEHQKRPSRRSGAGLSPVERRDKL